MNGSRDIAANLDRVFRSEAGRNIITAIGVDRYQHWPQLRNAVNDATSVLSLFRRLGFELASAPLLDDQATGPAMQRLVTDDLSTLGENDSLVIFYAGHGAVRTRRLEGVQPIKTGYLVPADAPAESGRVAALIALDEWLRNVSTLPPRHILVILDTCYSGIALSPMIKWRRDRGMVPATQYAALRRRRSRLVIASTLDDEVAPDTGPTQGHSLFTSCLIDALTGGLPGDFVRDARQYVTGSELGRYIQRRVLACPERTRVGRHQTPDFGSFDFDDRGEMAIPLLEEEPRWMAVSTRKASPPPIPPRNHAPLGTSWFSYATFTEITTRIRVAGQRLAGQIVRWHSMSRTAQPQESRAVLLRQLRPIFGISGARLSQPAFQNLGVLLVGAAWFAAAAISHIMHSVLLTIEGFEFFAAPLIFGTTCVAFSAIPALQYADGENEIRQAVLFGYACIDMVILQMTFLASGVDDPLVGAASVLSLAYFALALASIVQFTDPGNRMGRFVAAVSGICLAPSWVRCYWEFYQSELSFGQAYAILQWLVLNICMICTVFALLPRRWRLLLQIPDSFSLAISAILISWPLAHHLLLAFTDLGARSPTAHVSARLLHYHALFRTLAQLAAAILTLQTLCVRASAQRGKLPPLAPLRLDSK